MTGYDDIKVFLCSHAHKFDPEVSVEIKIRRAPHELFLKKEVFLINFRVAGRFLNIKQLAGKI